MANPRGPRAQALVRLLLSSERPLDRQFLALRELCNSQSFGTIFAARVRVQLRKATSLLSSGTRQERLAAYEQFVRLLEHDERNSLIAQCGLRTTWQSAFRKKSLKSIVQRDLESIVEGKDRFAAGLAALVLEKPNAKHARTLAHFLRYPGTLAARDSVNAIALLGPELLGDSVHIFRYLEKALFAALLREQDVESGYHLGTTLGSYLALRKASRCEIDFLLGVLQQGEPVFAAGFIGVRAGLGENTPEVKEQLFEILDGTDLELSRIALRALPSLGVQYFHDIEEKLQDCRTRVFLGIAAFAHDFPSALGTPEDLLSLSKQLKETSGKISLLTRIVSGAFQNP